MSGRLMQQWLYGDQPHPGTAGVNHALTPSVRPRRASARVRSQVENDDYMAFVARVVRAAGRRVATGDIEDLPYLVQLSRELDAAIQAAVDGLRADTDQTGTPAFSWGEIAARLGVTRQAVQQRWGKPQGQQGGGL